MLELELELVAALVLVAVFVLADVPELVVPELVLLGEPAFLLQRQHPPLT